MLLILCSLRTSFVSLASLLSSSTWIHGHSSTQSCPSKLEGGRTCIMFTFNWDETLVWVIIMSRRSWGFSSQMLVSWSPNFVSRTFFCGDGPLGDLECVVGQGSSTYLGYWTGVQYILPWPWLLLTLTWVSVHPTSCAPKLTFPGLEQMTTVGDKLR